MHARLGNCPDCGGSAVFRSGRGGCLTTGCWWTGEVLSDLNPEAPEAPERVEDLPLGMYRLRVERVGPADYCWSIYIEGNGPDVHLRGRSVSRELAWRDALWRIHSAEG